MYLPISSLPNPTPIGDFEQASTPDKTYAEDLLEVFEVATPATRQEILDKIDSDYLSVEAEGRSIVSSVIGSSGQLVDNALASGVSPLALRTMLESYVQKGEVANTARVGLDEYLVASSDGTPQDMQFAANRSMMSRKLEQAMLDDGVTTQGWVATGWDFFDRFILRMPGQTYEDFTARTSRMGMRLIDIAMLPPREAEAAMDEYIKGVRSEGVLTGRNKFAYEQALKEFQGMGYNPMEGFEQITAAFDIATGVTASLTTKVAAKLARNVEGKILKTANIKGPEAAGRVAEDLIRKQDDPDAIVQAGTGLIDPRQTPSNLPAVKGTSVAPYLPSGNPLFIDGVPYQVINTNAPRLTAQAAPSSPVTNTVVLNTNTPVPPMATAAKAVRTNQLLEEIDKRFAKGYAARPIDSAELQKRAQKFVGDYTTRTSRPVLQSFITRDLFNDKVVTVRFGDQEGRPFRDAGSAQKFIDNLNDGTRGGRTAEARAVIVQIDPADPEVGFAVQFSERIKRSGAAKAVDTSSTLDPLRSVIAKFAASSSVLDDMDNYVRALQGEATSSGVAALARIFSEKINGLSLDSRYAMNEVFRDLRDGIDADLKDYYSVADFEKKFMSKHPDHRLPTDKEIEAYWAIRDIEEASYFMRASVLLEKFNEAGFMTIRLGEGRFVAKEANRANVPSTAAILDSNSTVIRKDQLDDSDVVWQLTDRIGTNKDILYVRNPEAVRILEYEDVLGYNAGGRRTYTDGNFFVVHQGAGGELAAKIIARTEKQAKRAVKQINEILDGIRAGVVNVDDLVKRNNDWNPSIGSEADFLRWANDSNIDLTSGKIVWKTNRGIVSDQDLAGAAGVPDITWGERISMQQARSNTPLMRFGGGLANTEDPVSAIGQHLSSATHTLTNQAAIRQGIDGWVRAVLDDSASGWSIPQEAINTGDYALMYRSATRVGASSQKSTRLQDIRDIIENRHNITRAESTDDWLDAKIYQFGEWIIDLNSAEGKAYKAAGRVPGLNWMGGKIQDAGSPVNNLLKMGFGATFGLFNLSQAFVQAVHGSIMIPLIAGNTSAIKGLFLQGPIRAAMLSRGTGTGRLLAERTAAKIGIDTTTFDQLMDYIQYSGRAVIGNEVLEMGTKAGSGITRRGGTSTSLRALNSGVDRAARWTSKAYESSFVAYRSGEQFSRLSAMTTAFFEFKKKFPTGNPLSDEGLRWIYGREQALSFHMTNAGRAWMQQGFGRFPTQWLSYSFRSMEAVFIGRELSAGERARAAFAASALWGANGMGMAWLADYFGENFGIEPDSALYTGIRDGVLDGMLDGVGLEIAVGDRLAPLKGLLDVFRDSAEQSGLETIVGPSGTIVGGGAVALTRVLSGWFSDQPEITWAELERVARTASAVDSAFKAASILKYGYMRSKNGFKYEDEKNELGALITLAGFSTKGVAETNVRRDQVYRADKDFAAFRKRMNNYMGRAAEYIESSDESTKAAGFQLLRDIEVEVRTSNLSLYQQQQVLKGLMEGHNSTLQKLYTTLYQQDRAYAAEATWARIKGND